MEENPPVLSTLRERICTGFYLSESLFISSFGLLELYRNKLNNLVQVLKMSVTQGGPIVTLLAGRDRKPFKVHREILCAKSPYFSRLLLSHNYSDLTLDADPATIALFVNFLYWQHYTLPRSCQERAEQLFTHARLYILGIRFRIARLQEEALLKIYLLVKDEQRCDDRRLELIREVYMNTAAPEDELRKMLVATVAVKWVDYRKDLDVESELGMLLEEFPAFMRDVLGRLGNGGVVVPPQHLVQVRSMKRKKSDCD